MPEVVKEFRLPDLGEGLTEAELLTWSVDIGDRLELNQVIGEVETAKATVELPSPYAGTVAELLAVPGETVPVGAPLLRITVTGDAPAEEPAESDGQVAERPPQVLVGYGPGAAPVSKRAARRAEPARSGPERSAPAHRPDAKPGARREAERLGIDLATVPGSGPNGVITRADVQRRADEQAAPASAPGRPETRVPITGVRKRTADAVTRSAFTAPHATVFLTCDVMRTVELVAQLRESRAFEGRRLTPLTVVARALLSAVADEPGLNSRWDEEAREIVVHHRVQLGVATATDEGLKVPVVRDADALSLPELAAAIATAVDAARSGRAAPADLIGSTISITNVGVFGIDTGTPILNPGEAAILAVGAIADRPWVVDGTLAVRKVVTLSLSFDHRLVDGEQAGKALTSIAAFLADPVPALLAGT